MNDAPRRRSASNRAVPPADDDHDARLREILEASPLAVSITSLDGKRLWMNQELVRSRGIPYDQLLRRHSSEVFVDLNVREALLEELAKHGRTRPREVEMQRPDGSRHWTLFSLSKVTYEDQAAKISWAFDITRRKLAEQALTESEERFRNLVDNFSQGIILHQDLKPVYVNQAFVDLYGFDSKEEILALPSTLELIDQERSDPREYLDKTKDGQPASNIEYVGIKKDGTRFWVHRTSFAIEWQGKPTVCSARMDITDRKEAERLIAVQRDELAALNREKDRFFSIVAHDLKTPFNTLLGMTQFMAGGSKGLSREQLMDYAGDVNDAANQVYDLLQNLLEWSRLQMEAITFEPGPVALRELTEECADLLRPAAAEKEIQLTNRVRGTRAFADRDMVRTVLRNLISNALKFTPTGGRVTVSARKSGKRVEVTVADNGIGMTADRLKGLFTLDRKRSTIGTAGERGTGLGLPLCKDMLARNDGDIRIDSAPGKGTRVRFTLPAEG